MKAEIDRQKRIDNKIENEFAEDISRMNVVEVDFK